MKDPIHRRARRSRTAEKIKRILAGVESSFFDVMRRHPKEGDRSFYWSYCYSNSEFKDMTIKIMLHAKTPQHLIYIFDKTGFMVNEHGYKRLSKEEKEEIKQANARYAALEEDGKGEIYKLSDYEDFESTDDPLVNALYVFGNFIERNINSGLYKVDDQRFICSYLIVRAYRIVRAIFRSQRYTTSEEALVLVRSLYEIYCKLCYAIHSKKNAKYLFDSDFGLAFGVYEVLRKDGVFKRNILVHKRTRKTIPRTRSFYEYVSSSPFAEDAGLFSILYEYLSSFVHSGSRHIFKAWIDGEGFALTQTEDENFKVFVSLLTCLISSMIMQALLKLRPISKFSKWDISLFCYVTRQILANVGTLDHSEISDLLPMIKARAAVLPARVLPAKSVM
jgi:hypothetical protein